jgi:hypothetical protein
LRLDPFLLADLRPPLLDEDFLELAFLDVDLLELLFLEADFLDVDFLDDDFFLPPFLEGTLAPSFLASDNPIAIACFLEVTFLPLRPLFSLPRFFSCIALSTFLPARFEYFAMIKLIIEEYKKDRNYCTRQVLLSLILKYLRYDFLIQQ